MIRSQALCLRHPGRDPHRTMFCCCAAGRLLLQIRLRQIDEIEYTFELLAAEAIDHMGVFLLGTG